jgi:hypothetical membrane protein
MTLKLLVYGWAVLSGYLVWKAPEFEDKVAVGAALFIVLLFLIVLATSHYEGESHEETVRIIFIGPICSRLGGTG